MNKSLFFKSHVKYIKSDQHLTLYDSFNAEVTVANSSKHKVEKITNTYSIMNDLEFDLTNNDQKHQL